MGQPKIISIEGNIGSGKSTLVEHLKSKFERYNKTVYFLDEPVETWESIKDAEGNSMITKYYNDQKKYAFSFQMMAYISRLSLLKKALKKIMILLLQKEVYTRIKKYSQKCCMMIKK